MPALCGPALQEGQLTRMQRSVCQIITHIGDQKGELCCSTPLTFVQSYGPVCARAPVMLGHAVPLPAFCCHGWDCLRLAPAASLCQQWDPCCQPVQPRPYQGSHTHSPSPARPPSPSHSSLHHPANALAASHAPPLPPPATPYPFPHPLSPPTYITSHILRYITLLTHHIS